MGQMPRMAVGTGDSLRINKQGSKERPTLRGGIMGRAGFSFFVAVAAVNASNFLFHLVVGRIMGPERYGEAMALLNLLLVLSVVLGAVQAAATQAEATALASDEAGIALRPLLIRLGGLGAAATVAMAMLSPSIAGFLHMGSPIASIVLAGWIAPALISAVAQGVLMARLSFAPVGLAMFVGTGLGRLACGVVLVEAGLGVDGVIAASVIGQLLTTSLLLWALRSELGSSVQATPRRSISLADSAASVAALSGYWVLASIDPFVVRHLLNARQAGWYAAASTAGRMALFLPGAVTQLAFPRFATDNGTGQGARRSLARSLVAVGAMGLAAAAVLALASRLVISVLFGAKYAPAASAVGLLGVEGALVALISLLTYFHLARRSPFAYVGWIGSVLAGSGVWLFHGSLQMVAVVMVIATSLTMLIALAGVIPTLGKRNEVNSSQRTTPRPAMKSLGPAELDLTVVVPFYNPGPRLRMHIEEVASVLEATGITFEIIAVSDGCTDDSLASLGGVAPEVLRCVDLQTNSGKGEALRVGLLLGRGQYLGFIDADGDIPAQTLVAFVDCIKSGRADIVSGSKRHPDSKVIYPPLRRIYSWGYQQLLKVLFRLDVADTQTGIKLVRREVVADALPLMLEKRFAFDLELFVVAKRVGYRRFEELPITIKERYTSTISTKAVKAMLLDTLAIFYRLQVLHYYDRPVERLQPADVVANRPLPPASKPRHKKRKPIYR